jgi:hypothetical protein
MTDFKFLSHEWIQNTQEERLLGVSLTGIMDAKITANPDPKLLERLRDEARKTKKSMLRYLIYLNQQALHVLSLVVQYLSWWILLVVFMLVIMLSIYGLFVWIRKILLLIFL